MKQLRKYLLLVLTVVMVACSVGFLASCTKTVEVEKMPQQTVTFYDGVKELNSIKVDKATNITESTYTAPTKEGYEFAGWYTDIAYQTKFDFSELILKDTKLFAKYNDANYVETRSIGYVGAAGFDTNTNSSISACNNWGTDIAVDLTGTRKVDFEVTLDLYKGDAFQFRADAKWVNQWGIGCIEGAVSDDATSPCSVTIDGELCFKTDSGFNNNTAWDITCVSAGTYTFTGRLTSSAEMIITVTKDASLEDYVDPYQFYVAVNGSIKNYKTVLGVAAEYTLTTDREINTDKTYYTVETVEGVSVYTAVEDPSVDSIANYYELTTEAVEEEYSTAASKMVQDGTSYKFTINLVETSYVNVVNLYDGADATVMNVQDYKTNAVVTQLPAGTHIISVDRETNVATYETAVYKMYLFGTHQSADGESATGNPGVYGKQTKDAFMFTENDGVYTYVLAVTQDMLDAVAAAETWDCVDGEGAIQVKVYNSVNAGWFDLGDGNNITLTSAGYYKFTFTPDVDANGNGTVTYEFIAPGTIFVGGDGQGWSLADCITNGAVILTETDDGSNIFTATYTISEGDVCSWNPDYTECFKFYMISDDCEQVELGLAAEGAVTLGNTADLAGSANVFFGDGVATVDATYTITIDMTGATPTLTITQPAA